MPEPKIIRTIETEGVIPLGGLLKLADLMGCKLQDDNGQSPFLWLFRHGETVTVILTEWDSGAEKHATIDALRDTLKTFPQFDAYASIFEVWMSEQRSGIPRKYAMPRNDPNRKSALLIYARERGGEQKEKVYEVTYDPNGRPYRKERKHLKGYGAGYMFNLFEPPSYPPRTPMADA